MRRSDAGDLQTSFRLRLAVKQAAAALTMALALMALPAVAEAAKRVDSYFGATGAAGGQFASATGIGGVAVRESTGDVYVVDRGAHRVQQFDAAGDFVRAWGQDVIVNAGTPANSNGTGFEVCDTTTVPANVPSDCKAGITSASTGGAMSTPRGVAIDQASGNVYVTDGGFLRVQEFTAAGEFVRAWGQDVIVNAGTPANSNGTGFEVCDTTATFPNTAAECKTGVAGGTGGAFATTFQGYPAVVPAGAPNAGNVLVADPGNRRVQEFTGAGAFVRAWGFGVDSGQAGDGFEVCAVASQCTIAIAATTAAAAADGQFPTNQPQRVAADAQGAVYTTESTVTFRAQRFTPDGSSLARATFAPLFLSASQSTNAPTDVVVDPGSGNVFVVKGFIQGGGGPPAISAERRVLELSSAGSLVSVHMVNTATTLNPSINSANGMGWRAATGRIYVSSTTGAQRVYVLDDDGATSPTAVVAPATAVGDRTATFNGTVNPNGGVLTAGYHFEYRRHGSDWTSLPATDVDVGNGTGDVVVSTAASELEANQTYSLRLVATKQFNGARAVSGETTFTTDPLPVEDVTTLPAAPVRGTTARIHGRLNANNQPVTYYFEHGPDAGYGSRTPEASAGGGLTTTVSAWLTGLAPGATYHYRLVVDGPLGELTGADQVVTTGADLPTDDRGVPLSPTGRAYEMVTPPEKASRRFGTNGVEGRTMNSGVPTADGEAIRFGLFAGTVGEPEFAFTFAKALARRSDEAGWVNSSLAPLKVYSSATTAGWDPSGISDDFRRMTVTSAASRVLLPELLSWPVDSYPYTYIEGEGLTSFLADPSQNAGSASDAGAVFSADGSRIVRYARYRGVAGPSDPSVTQLAGAAGGRTIYAHTADGGDITLVNGCTGVGADATMVPSVDAGKLTPRACEQGQLISPRGANLGQALGTARGAATMANAMSDDGSRIFFHSPDAAALTAAPSAPNSGCTGTGVATLCQQELYVRQRASDGTDTVRWISRPRVASQDATLVGGSAHYEGAAADGSVVYFRSNSPLTEDDPNGTGAPVPGGVTTGTASGVSWDLYRYELPSDPAADPDDGTLTRVTAGPTGAADPNASCSGSSSVLCGGGALRYLSRDGSRVYFATAAPIPGVPSNDAPTNGTNTTAGGAALNATTRNLYLFDANESGADRWRFIAQLPIGAGLDDCATRSDAWIPPLTVSTVIPDGGIVAVADRNCLRGTRDGELIVFMTAGKLVASDTDSAVDLYAYDAAADELTRLTAPPVGGTPYRCSDQPVVDCNGSLGTAELGTAPANEAAAGRDALRYQNVTDDGTVYFETRLRLVPEDVNGTRMDTYEWKDDELALISPGSSDDDAYFSGNSRDGQDVFIHTTQAIDAREIDPGDGDIYDARVGGGFAPPPIPAPGCSVHDDACQGPGAGAVGAEVRTGGDSGAGNAPSDARRRLALAAPPSAARRRAARSGVLSIRVRVSVDGRVRAVARARVGGKRRVVGRGAVLARGPGRFLLRVRLSDAAKRRLRAGHALRVTIEVGQVGARSRSMSIRLPGAES